MKPGVDVVVSVFFLDNWDSLCLPSNHRYHRWDGSLWMWGHIFYFSWDRVDPIDRNVGVRSETSILQQLVCKMMLALRTCSFQSSLKFVMINSYTVPTNINQYYIIDCIRVLRNSNKKLIRKKNLILENCNIWNWKIHTQVNF